MLAEAAEPVRLKAVATGLLLNLASVAMTQTAYVPGVVTSLEPTDRTLPAIANELLFVLVQPPDVPSATVPPNSQPAETAVEMVPIVVLALPAWAVKFEFDSVTLLIVGIVMANGAASGEPVAPP